MVALISKAYTQISVDKAAAMLGVSSERLLQGETAALQCSSHLQASHRILQKDRDVTFVFAVSAEAQVVGWNLDPSSGYLQVRSFLSHLGN